MRILLTNDDGYDAPGIILLKSIAKKLAGPEGEVWTIAPMVEMSGTSHCVSFIHPFRIQKITPFDFKVEGNPADCVLAGVCHVMTAPPDLILSGINRGNNSGENTLYSGTIGAVMEGALQGFKSIAVSQYLGPVITNENNFFDASKQHSLNLLQQIYKTFPWDSDSYRTFLNINFPPCMGNEVKGVKFVRQGFRSKSKFSVTSYTAPNKREFLCIAGGNQQSQAEHDSDISANLENYISITPMRADLTDYSVLAQCEKKVFSVGDLSK